MLVSNGGVVVASKNSKIVGKNIKNTLLYKTVMNSKKEVEVLYLEGILKFKVFILIKVAQIV